VARAHVPGKATRLRKDQLRQRLYWSRLRTRIRNRLHALLDRQDDPCLPQCSDLFGSRGMSFLKKLRLTRPRGSAPARRRSCVAGIARLSDQGARSPHESGKYRRCRYRAHRQHAWDGANPFDGLIWESDVKTLGPGRISRHGCDQILACDEGIIVIMLSLQAKDRRFEEELFEFASPDLACLC
jgi:hypothetical protein